MDILCDALAAQGFEVEKGVADVPTAFTGRFGSANPSSAFWASTMPFPASLKKVASRLKHPLFPADPATAAVTTT
jgi:hypothetical protein